jgi:hypothetical protein
MCHIDGRDDYTMHCLHLNSQGKKRLMQFIAERVVGIAGWRKLHNEELQNLYSSPSIIRMIKDEMDRACSTNRGEEECIQDIGGKARWKETTGKTKT